VPDAPSIAHTRLRPTQQAIALRSIRAQRELRDDMLVSVDDRGGVRPFVRVDPDDEHTNLLIRSERRGGHS
jgi:hypothetical protein